MSNNGTQVTPQRLFQFAFGYAPPLMIEAGIRHRVFDVVDAGPKTLDEVSSETGASKRGLRAVMNAFVALELMNKDGEGRYSLTPESSTFLVTTKPSFHGGIFQHTSQQLLPKWLTMNEIVRTGEPATAVNDEDKGGAQFFTEFVEAIFPMSYMAAQALGDELGIAQAQQPVKVLDIAAGSGVWGIALAQKSPQVQVTAVDWEQVLEVTKRVANRFGVGDRFTYLPGDLMESDFGRGYNVATLGHILHSEGEARSKELLRKVYDALAPGGTVAIAEMVANEERTGPPHAMIFAVNMLVNTDAGDTFTFGEMNQWLRDAGFTNPRTVEAPGPSPLILATKA